ncbi:high-affinity branched-chain amino acid ABC transporter substrate-binding protein [Comamonadaceae bacterium OH2545_COT-014]|nr:high-affinity branched-chain amino acid ABC transporter substrate-binding protein [Comamonadaceae bacterium OH2545_COT-014]
MQSLTKIAAAVLVMGLAQGAAAAGGVIKIGVAGPQTGPVAQFGDMARTGAEAAVAAINKAGGVNGDKLQLVHYDDACDPKQAVAVANKIVNDKVKFVVGHVCSAATQAASDVYADEDVLMVSPSATAPAITERGHKLVFRTIGLDSAQAPVAIQYITAHFKGKTVAVLHDKQQYGEGIATAVKKGLDAGGMKVALFEGLNAGDKDFNALVAKLKRANVDLVYFGGYHPELGLLMRQARQAGLQAAFMGPDGAGNKEISVIAGDASEGMLVTLPRAFETDPKNKALVDSFNAAGKDPSGVYVLPAYAAVQVIADGIKKAGAQDAVKVADVLRAGSFETPIGTIGFDAKGDVKNFAFVVYRWHKDGSKTEIK